MTALLEYWSGTKMQEMKITMIKTICKIQIMDSNLKQ